ncbi:MAG TPA: hypothetical protein VFC71_00825 [Candidatus Polarisedimenticolia bacterium]|nr:hypothetical protein [Candidatus Polarisedimenticolia bacterium]
MTEILTESFCERCGTRYTFETVAPRQKKLGGLKTLGRGLKTFVLSDDTSLDEAFATARSDEERELAGHQLDAFHKTFNFCMNCRQYTCANCWNPIEARCLSCAPRADQVIGEAPLQLATAGGGVAAPELAEPAWPVEFDAAEPEVPVLDAADLLGRLDATEVEPAAAWPEHIHEPEPEHVHEPEPEHVYALDAEHTHEIDAEHVHEPEAEHDAAAATNGLEPDLQGLLAASAELAAASQAAPAAPAAEEESPAAALFEAAAEEAAEAAADAAVEAAEQAAAEAAAEAAAQAAAEAAFQAAADTAARAAAEAAAQAAAQAAAAPPSVEARARDAAAATGALLGRFRPGQNLDAEIAAYERSLADETAEVPEPAAAEPAAAEPELVAVEPEPEMAAPVSEPAAEPVVAAEPAPEPVAAEPAPEPVAIEPTPEPEPVSAADAPEPEAPATRRDIVEQPAWPRPEMPEAAPEVEPAWPVGPRWPTAVPARPEAAPPPPPQAVAPPFPPPAAANPAPAAEADPLAFLTARRAGEAMWAASAQDVVAAAARPGENIPAAVRSCVSCGLSLSATARFCRRCGTRQEEV